MAHPYFDMVRDEVEKELQVMRNPLQEINPSVGMCINPASSSRFRFG